ncbi:zinc metallopeptidase mde10 [Aspergillus nomiae NRRL 13137]|uniref:Disintegrin and metalloproteinase domain-containing protein B n=1 Tax=Aspergillus nomiae NRRL (strain ATCC 15546 / NRRL 13137 / CBS 260.88 / M93) TaxID=1509407 RepID=A0A0L1JE47_ASPN3|nr:zinc metallopeptidase mde10 [Aspergillus nomiae NRRL 13137]KNG89942.1 zinc metallopeptidase mde10 [Aspergillus nomiae NRRL 13137]
MRIYPVLLLFAPLLVLLSHVQGHSIRSPPSQKASQLESVVIHTPSQQIASESEFDITFRIRGQDDEIRLKLERNSYLLVHRPQIQYLDTEGVVKRTESFIEEDQRVFRGGVWIQVPGRRWEKVGWARIYIVRDGDDPLFEGTFSAFSHYYDVRVLRGTVEEVGLPANDGSMVAYHSSRTDLRRDIEDSTEPSHCAADQLIPHSLTPRMISVEDSSHGLFPNTPSSLERRQSTLGTDDLVNSIGSHAGCPTSRRVALVGIATDCTYTASFESTESLRRSLINMVNTASELFESTFNISLALHNLTISDANCPGSATDSAPWNVGCSEGDMNWRLQQFSSWRSSLSDTENAYWTLMTGCPSGSEVGISWIGQLCNSQSSTNVVARTSNQWQVFAHESGHTFGAVHDCDSSTCSSSTQCCPLSSSTCDADAQYIMNPYSQSSQTEFSPCTVGNVCSLLGSRSMRTGCLLSDTSNIPTLTAGECGNGIVEAGEDCDCGDNCDDNSCCDGSTCRFRDGAVCDDSAGPCCTNCQFASSATVCRESTGSCDIQETCTGNSSACPTDRFAPDGQTCGNSSGLFCASGECMNRDMQCQRLLNTNSTGVSSCNSDSCTLSCSVDWYGSGTCMGMNRQVQDGTPCSDGFCRSGRCRSDSEDSSSWVDRHRSLVIGLSAGIGGALVLAVLLSIIFCCCCRRKKTPTKGIPPAPPVTGQVPRVPPPYAPASPTRSIAPPNYRYA